MVTDFKKKQKAHTYKYLLIALGGVAICVLAIVLIVANIKIYQKKQELNAQVENLKNKIAQAQEKNTKLEQGIAQSNQNAYIEKVAREELDLQQPGEKVVSFVASKKEETAAVQPQAQNWWDKFLGFLHWGSK